MAVDEQKVQAIYDKIIESVNKIARQLSNDDSYALHEKLKKFFAGGVFNEGRENQESGLMVVGRMPEDNTKVGEMVMKTGLHAEWNAREGYWFFPEEEDSYDELEKWIQSELDSRDINARIEGVFGGEHLSDYATKRMKDRY